jgi:ABC-type transport system involved in multi-copper enzyme maturation permease subunit
MIALVKSELRKFFSTRMWWILLLVGAGYIGIVAVLMIVMIHWGATETDGLVPGGAEYATMIYTIGSALGYIFPALIGVLSVGGEFRHQTITPTLLAEPQRWRVLIGKVLAVIPVGALFGVVMTGASVGLGGATFLLLGETTGLGSSHTWQIIARTALAITVWAIVGVGLGTLLKNQLVAIITLLVFTQFVEPLLRMLPLMTGRELPILAYLPGAAGDSIAGDSMYSAMTEGLNTSLSLPGGLAVLIGLGLVFAAIGYFTTLRRDIS